MVWCKSLSRPHRVRWRQVPEVVEDKVEFFTLALVVTEVVRVCNTD